MPADEKAMIDEQIAELRRTLAGTFPADRDWIPDAIKELQAQRDAL